MFATDFFAFTECKEGLYHYSMEEWQGGKGIFLSKPAVCFGWMVY
jgi:hypothetical protein